MSTTSTQIANQALQLMGGNQPVVTGAWPNFVGPSAQNNAISTALNLLYGDCVAAVMRQFAWDFTRSTAVLVPSGNVAPYPFPYEYLYPANCIEVWQLSPTSEIDPNDPLPVNYVVANALVGGQQKRVIQTLLSPAQAIFNNFPVESTWDALFTMAVIRLLASELAMAIAGKPDTSESLIQSGSAFETLGEGRRD